MSVTHLAPAPIITVEHISQTYYSDAGETKALSDLSFSLNKGEFVAIVGPSGCGKSTLLDLIAGFVPLTEGQIAFFDTSFSRIGYMLQKDHLLEHRTIYKNVLLGLEIQHQLTKENIDFATRLMQQYDIEDFANSYPRQLSGGMRQRAALIRTLACRPDILLLDEPFSALDYQTRLDVCDDISGIIREQGITSLLVTHDISEAISIADRVIILSKRPGRIVKIVTITFPNQEPATQASATFQNQEPATQASATFQNQELATQSSTRISPRKARSHQAFQEYFEEIWAELRDKEET